MAYFPGNFINGIAAKLQYRLFLLPDLIVRVKRNNRIIFCAKGRHYSSSIPVKYIPKKSLKNEESEAASFHGRYLQERNNGFDPNVADGHFSKNPSKILLDAESDDRDLCAASKINYVEEEIEGGFTAVDEAFIEERDNIAEGSSKRSKGIQLGCTCQDVEKLAIELLASRAFTALELKKKLQAKRVPLEIVDAVITDFQNRGLINDGLYAEAYARSRWSSSSWGPRRIRQALFKKGVSEADAQKAIKLVFENDEDDGDQDPGISMSNLSFNQLYVQASKQWQRSRGVAQETRKSRMVRWLQYRGFNWSVISHVLKKLESESPR